MKNLLTDEQMSTLFYQMALMARAGIGDEEALLLLLEDAENGVQTGMENVRSGLAQGQALSQALGASGCFPPYALQMLRIGELAGRQEEVFAALANFYSRAHTLKQSIRQAVVYPVVMAVLIAVVFFVLVGRVMPVFSGVFDQLGLTLPPVAATLLGLGGVSQYLAGGLAGLLLLLAIILLGLYRSGKVREESLVRGKSAECVARSRFSSSMALMLASGLPIDEAMEQAQTLLAGTVLSEPIDRCTQKVREGQSFPQAAASCQIYSALETGLLKAGFRAGMGERAMEELARRNQEQAEEQLNRFLSRFQFGLVLVLCAAVGLVLLSVMLPLIGVLAAIGG